MTVLALERLPPGASVTSAILLQAAISPGYDLSAALEHTEQGIWNFCSLLDLFFVGIGTSVAGTLDGRHTLAAGMVGFRLPVELNAAARELYRQRLHEVPFRLAMMADFHFGGHFGPSNRVFAARHLATLLGERKPCQ